jgi:hypothetical protein
VFNNVTVISHALLASSFDTNIDLTSAVALTGTVYNDVLSVVVKSTFLFKNKSANEPTPC